MKAKHQRLTLALLALVAVIAASVLALSGLKDQASFFYAPSDVQRDGLSLGKAVRLGGLVAPGSIKHLPDGISVHFVVTDGKASVSVTFAGIVPDLFRENSGVVAEGHFQPDGSFIATNLLAKHDANYKPPQLAGAMHKTESLKQ
jgi:cytochrome c-type biogenesis protein CcmE